MGIQKKPVLDIAARLMLLAGWLMLAAGCGTPPKVVRQDPELERNVALAGGAFAAGSAEKAAGYYLKALDRARLMDDPAAIGRNAYNLAACLALLGRDDEALALLDEADAEFQRAGTVAREIPLLKARIASREGKTDEALALVQAQLKTKMPGDSFYRQYQILLADLLCAKGDSANAARELARVDRDDLEADAPAIQADADRVRARIALLDKKPRDAGGFFDAAAHQLQQAGQYVEMALALDNAGRAYEAAGDLDVALNRYYRATRSLFLAGRTEAAGELMTRALQLADRAGAMAMRSKLVELKTDMSAASKPAAQ